MNMEQGAPDALFLQLCDAIKQGNFAHFRRLLENNPNLAKQQGGTTAIHQTVHFHQTSFLEFLLAQGVDPNVYDANGKTALHWACGGGQLTAVTLILAARGRLNAPSIAEGRTALHYAVDGTGYVNVAAVLLSHGASPNAADRHGVTPLHLAMSNPNIDIARLLIQRKANPNAKDNLGRTPLHYAGERLDMAKILLLIDSGSHGYMPDPVTGATVLHWASELDDVETIRRILEQGTVPLNVQDKNGATALHLAAFNGHLEACLLLLAKGASPAIPDKWKNKASDHAGREGHREVAEALRNAEKIWYTTQTETLQSQSKN